MWPHCLGNKNENVRNIQNELWCCMMEHGGLDGVMESLCILLTERSESTGVSEDGFSTTSLPP